MKLPALLIPKNQNNMQRLGFATALIGMVLLVVLHNPVGGYTTTEAAIWADEIINPQCTKEEVKWAQRMHVMVNKPIEEWQASPGYSDSPPDGIESWPFSKQFEWKYGFLGRANTILHRCLEIRSGTIDKDLPFSEWRSNSPVIGWFASLPHLLETLFAVAVCAMIWLIVFQPKRDTDAH